MTAYCACLSAPASATFHERHHTFGGHSPPRQVIESWSSRVYSKSIELSVSQMEEFELIYATHVNAVLRYARRCVGREDVAEEIVSEAFMELYRNMERIHVDQLPAWLCTVVKHKAVDYWRRDRLERRYLEEQRQKPEIQETNRDQFLEFTAKLKPAHATCLLLRYVHGMTRTEIARATGMTEIQVKSALQYARELLRREYAGEPQRKDLLK